MAEPLTCGLSGYLIVKSSPKLKLKKKIFIICPVRNIPEKIKSKITAYATKLESEGYEVYLPYRDNPYQDTDKVGITICDYNHKKMLMADEVHIWYDRNSMGSVFDIGMFFMFVRIKDFKKFVIINPKDITPTPYKSFENVILALAKEFDNPMADGLKEKWEKYGK